jgi:hypothetical protein
MFIDSYATDNSPLMGRVVDRVIVNARRAVLHRRAGRPSRVYGDHFSAAVISGRPLR